VNRKSGHLLMTVVLRLMGNVAGYLKSTIIFPVLSSLFLKADNDGALMTICGRLLHSLKTHECC